jgi:hypothetical protein
VVRLVPTFLPAPCTAAMDSLPPVSPGSLGPASTASVGAGSAGYDIEADLAAQMQGEFDQASPAEPDGVAMHPYEENGDDDEDPEDGYVPVPHPVSTHDASVYTAHQDFQRAASHYVSPMGYDQPSPSEWSGEAPAEATVTSNAPDYSSESVLDAFARFTALGASSMGYDASTPSVASGLEHPLGPIADGIPEEVEMNDSSKRGRDDPLSPTPSSVRPPPKRSAAPAVAGAGAAPIQTAPAPLPSPDAVRLLALTREVSLYKAEREGMQARVVAAESAAQASVRNSEAAVGAFRAQLAESTRQAEAFKDDLVSRHQAQLDELRVEATTYRGQAEAQVTRMIEEMRATAEASHGEAMSRAAAGYAAKEHQHVLASRLLQHQCLLLQRTAHEQLEKHEAEKAQARQMISDLTLASTVSGLSSSAGLPGVLPDVQAQLDMAAQTMAVQGAELQRSNGTLAQYESALRGERHKAEEAEARQLAFQTFVQNRETELRGQTGSMQLEIQHLNQKLFSLEQPRTPALPPRTKLLNGAPPLRPSTAC